MEEKQRSPYRVFMWGALIMAAACFVLAAQRLSAKRPARADAYSIAGALGLLSAAAAWSLGSAHARSRRGQDQLRGALEGLEERMRDLPRALMEDSVNAAEKDRRERRADQERQAAELRGALEDGLNRGLAPLAPAVAERMEASLGSLAESLRADREERARGLREMEDILARLGEFQREWGGASTTLLENLREQGTSLQKEISERDAGWRSGLERLTEGFGARFQEASDIHLAKARDVLEGLAGSWEKTAESGLDKMESAVSLAAQASRETMALTLQEANRHFERSAETLLRGLSSARESMDAIGAEASGRLLEGAQQSAVWMQKLSEAAETLREAAREALRVGEASSATQDGFKAAVETLNQGLGGAVERLQSLASLAQGQEALLEKMEGALRRFEERSSELLEDNAMKIQESFLDALERAESGSGNA